MFWKSGETLGQCKREEREREREWWAKALDPVLKRGEGYAVGLFFFRVFFSFLGLEFCEGGRASLDFGTCQRGERIQKVEERETREATVHLMEDTGCGTIW